MTVPHFVAHAVVHRDTEPNTQRPPTSKSVDGRKRGGGFLKHRQSTWDGILVEMSFKIRFFFFFLQKSSFAVTLLFFNVFYSPQETQTSKNP